MIQFTTGNILTTEAEAIVNTVNCVGVMGRGIALQYKKAYPDNFKAYAAACREQKVQPGHMFIYETGTLTYPRFIINFPTKRHWRGKSRMNDVEDGLKALVKDVKRLGISSIALPPLGSGLGGLEWESVKQLIEKELSHLDEVKIIVFEPQINSDKLVKLKEVPTLTPGRAALVSLMNRYINGLLDPFVSLLEVHKLMYFMQEAGEPLRLKFKKAEYGPYAENLRHVLHRVEGHYISGYDDGGDNPDKPLSLVPGANEDAEKFIKEHSKTQEHFERVTELVSGFESSFGLELLSTVHWLVKQNGASSIDEIIQQTYAWNEGKKQFSERQLTLAYEKLTNNDWLFNPKA